MGYLFAVLTVIFTVCGQMLVKWRVSKHGVLPEGITPKIIFLFHCLTDPFILLGFVAAFLAAMMWIVTVSKLDISQAYPFITATLTLLTVMGGIFIFSEPLTWQKLAAVVLICSGVLIMNIRL